MNKKQDAAADYLAGIITAEELAKEIQPWTFERTDVNAGFLLDNHGDPVYFVVLDFPSSKVY